MKKIILIGLSLALASTSAFADASLEAPTFGLDDIVVVAGALLTAMAGMWAIKKGLSLAK